MLDESNGKTCQCFSLKELRINLQYLSQRILSPVALQGLSKKQDEEFLTTVKLLILSHFP